MVRHTLSQPMSLMVQHALIGPGITVFDYGCGQGDDLRALTAAGIESSGWDPHFASDAPLREAHVVNLGFVLNVIEDAAERRIALASAWRLARSQLIVSTMVMGQVPTDGLTPFRDGFLTSRGTFQKYFSQAELRALVSEITGVEPVAAANGIFIAFRHDEDQEEFLLRRRMGRRLSTEGYRAPRTRRTGSARAELVERLAPLLAELADLVVLRGRMPAPEEIPSGVLAQLDESRVSVRRALDLAMNLLPVGEFDKAAAAMHEDLLVHYALARLNGSRTAQCPSPSMVRDIRAHFGSQRELTRAAGEYLMQLADEGAIREAIVDTARQGNGAIDHRGRLLFDAAQSESLPGLLRTYLGCAAYLAGEPNDQSVVRIDVLRRSVAYLAMEDRKASFPVMTGITQIDLKRQDVRSFPTRRLLLAKSAVLNKSSRAQRQREQRWRSERGIEENRLMIRIEN